VIYRILMRIRKTGRAITGERSRKREARRVMRLRRNCTWRRKRRRWTEEASRRE
jgi:hypothetical protein